MPFVPTLAHAPATPVAIALVADDAGLPRHPALHDRFFLGAGASLATSTTEARLDPAGGAGTTVDLEDTLGLDETSIAPQGLLRWRFADRWRLELEAFELDRSETRELREDVEWGDETFPAGTEVATEFDVAVTRLSLGCSFFRREDKEIGIALGLHLTDVEARISGPGGATDGGDVLAPLPVVSLFGQIALTETWALGGRLDAFRVDWDPYEGHIASLGVDAIYQPFRHVGLGLGWRSLEFEVTAEREDWDGRMRSTFSGPIAFVAVSF